VDNAKKELVETALNALERLLKMFQLERVIYLITSTISILILLYAAYLLVDKKCANTEVIVAIFGGGGLVTAASARISFFFNKAFGLMESLIKDLSK